MKNRIVAIVCNSIAIVCWGILVWSGIYDRKPLSIVLYALCFVCSTISLIMNIVAVNKEKKSDNIITTDR